MVTSSQMCVTHLNVVNSDLTPIKLSTGLQEFNCDYCPAKVLVNRLDLQ